MASQTFQMRRAPSRTSAHEIREVLEAGDDVIINLGPNASPERVIKTIHALFGEHEVRLNVRHAEVRDYIDTAIPSSAIGAAVGVAAVLLAAYKSGSPITAAAILAAAGIGAVAGGLLGIGMAAVHDVTIYRHSGDTRVKILAIA